MGVSRGPSPIVTDGLVFAIDAGNTRCWASPSSTDVINLINPAITGSTINDNSPGPLDGGNGYFELDGTDDYIDFGEQSFLEGKTNLTVSCWHQSTVAANKVLWGASTTSVNSYLTVLIYHSSNKIYVEYNNGGTQYGLLNASTGDLAVDEWGEITVVFDASGGSAANNVKMYINGNYVAFSSFGGGAFSSTAADLDPFYLGSDTKYAAYDWQGYIGPTMVWNRSLTATEILQNYNSQKSRFGL